MKRFLFLGAAGGAAAWLLRRRGRQEPDVDVVFTPEEPAPEPPAYASERGAVEGQEERERESEATDETRYERLRDAESAEREDTAERLAAAPPEPERDES